MCAKESIFEISLDVVAKLINVEEVLLTIQ